MENAIKAGEGVVVLEGEEEVREEDEQEGEDDAVQDELGRV